MAGFILRKATSTLLTLFGVALLLFALFHLVGGDPAYLVLGKHADAARMAEFRAAYGFDQSLPWQFARVLREMATFDFGVSYSTHQPVGRMLLAGVGPTLTLVLPAFMVTLAVSVCVALWVAVRRGSTSDRLIVTTTVLGMSLPSLALILFCQYVLAFKLGWFPISGFESGWPDRMHYVALPILIWIVLNAGHQVRFYRSAFIAEMDSDYVRTARAKGAREAAVLFKHVLKNGAVPVLAYATSDLPVLLLAAFLLESFFGIPGLGGLTVDAIRSSDFPVIKAVTAVISVLFVIGNLLFDLLHGLLDPRVRA